MAAPTTPSNKYSEQELLHRVFDESTNALQVTGGGSSTADGATFTSGTTAGTIVEGVYQATPTTVADGKAGAVRISANRAVKTDADTQLAGEDLTNDVLGVLTKPVASSTYSSSLVANFGTDCDLSVKASAGNILSVTATNANAAIRYLQVHNKATAPANPDVPIISLPIPIGSTTVQTVTIGADILGQGGHYCSTGIAIGISTTNATYTAATAADHNILVKYV